METCNEIPKEISKVLLRPTWVEVDLDAIEHNVKTVKNWLGGLKLIGVLKGDACGFGTAECGATMESAGVDMLAVGSPFEVHLLRRHGIRCPILMFASYLPELAHEIATLDAIPTVVDLESTHAFAEAARNLGSKRLDIFLKVDTGLGRLGVPFAQAVSLVRLIAENPYLRLIGLYSHAGGTTDERAEEQYRRFQSVLCELDALGIDIPIKMIASTPHVLMYPHMWINAVDPGRLLFGIKHPPDATIPKGEIRPALRGLRTRIIQIKSVTPGDPPEYGYGHANKTGKYGVIPFGWVDVFFPSIYENSGAIVRGIKVRFLKSIFTEHSVIDLTEVPDAKVGDVVTLLGKEGDSLIDISQLARRAEILISEITRRFHRHLSYVYFKAGKPIKACTLSEETTIQGS